MIHLLKTYEECIAEFGSNHYLDKAIESGRLFKIEKGIYSDEQLPSQLSVVVFKYPNTIMTMESAFYYHGLTDSIPDEYVLCTERNGTKIKDIRIKQIFCQKKLFLIGKSKMEYQGIKLNIYDRERMLIELVRNREKLPYDYYKEIIRSYRDKLFDLDIEKMQEYIRQFPGSKTINEVIAREVF